MGDFQTILFFYCILNITHCSTIPRMGSISICCNVNILVNLQVPASIGFPQSSFRDNSKA